MLSLRLGSKATCAVRQRARLYGCVSLRLCPLSDCACFSPSTDLCSPFDVRILRCNNRIYVCNRM
jgi:hypothetical protein